MGAAINLKRANLSKASTGLISLFAVLSPTIISTAGISTAGALLLALLLAGVPAKDTLASPLTDAARAEVEKTIEQVKSHVASHKSDPASEEANNKLREILMPIFDFQDMSRSSLGANWKKATGEQQEEFVSVFSDLLARTYLDKIRENIQDSEIKYLPSMTKGDRVVIRTKVISGPDTIGIDYRMYQKDGVWKIYDVVVENIGLVSNYRNEFASILQREDFSGLLTRLKNQAASNHPQK